MSNVRPKVSVLVPVYNGERFLRQSLDSILAQTYPSLEVIVMDDASTDGTAEIVASYRSDKLKYHRQAQNKGIYGNMNDGIALAQGDYIAIYHADDLYEPTIVEREVAFLEAHPEAGAVFAKDIFIDADGREQGCLRLPPAIPAERLLPYETVINALLTYKNCFMRCPSCMVPAAVYRAIGPYRDQQFRNTSDVDMYLRIARRYPIAVLDQYLFRYRWGHGNSGQRYRHLRTDGDRFFTIVDLYLQEGDRKLATPDALRAFEAHRAQDHLMRVVNHYILGQLPEARQALKQVQGSHLAGSDKIQRGRMLLLFFLLQALVRLPRLPFVANLFYQRWHVPWSARATAKRGVLGRMRAMRLRPYS